MIHIVFFSVFDLNLLLWPVKSLSVLKAVNVVQTVHEASEEHDVKVAHFVFVSWTDQCSYPARHAVHCASGC